MITTDVADDPAAKNIEKKILERFPSRCVRLLTNSEDYGYTVGALTSVMTEPLAVVFLYSEYNGLTLNLKDETSVYEDEGGDLRIKTTNRGSWRLTDASPEETEHLKRLSEVW